MITFLASFPIALRALIVNMMRSALTMLGIIIGVSAVIAMIAVGSGAKAQITGSGTVPTLTINDAEAILSEIPSMKSAAPDLSGAAQVVYGNQNWSTSITGTVPELSPSQTRLHICT